MQECILIYRSNGARFRNFNVTAHIHAVNLNDEIRTVEYRECC